MQHEAGKYPRLRLHTLPALPGLPGLPTPARACPRLHLATPFSEIPRDWWSSLRLQRSSREVRLRLC